MQNVQDCLNAISTCLDSTLRCVADFILGTVDLFCSLLIVVAVFVLIAETLVDANEVTSNVWVFVERSSCLDRKWVSTEHMEQVVSCKHLLSLLWKLEWLQGEKFVHLISRQVRQDLRKVKLLVLVDQVLDFFCFYLASMNRRVYEEIDWAESIKLHYVDDCRRDCGDVVDPLAWTYHYSKCRTSLKQVLQKVFDEELAVIAQDLFYPIQNNQIL